MQLNVLDEITLVPIGARESWTSLLWVETYNTLGSFTLELPPTDANKSLFTVGRWLQRSDGNVPMRICTAATTNTSGNLILTGHDGKWTLSRRVSTAVISNENAQDAMRQLVRNMPPWPRLAVGPEADLPDKFPLQTSGGSILDYCTTIGTACDMGFDVLIEGGGENKALVFVCRKPEYNDNRRYSASFGNLAAEMFNFSDVAYCNVAVVQGAGEGSARATVTVGDITASGADRREMYVDARDIQPDEEETIDSPAYLAKLENRGLQKLQERPRREAIEFEVYDNSLQIGDIVKALLPDLGYDATARVTEIIYQSQPDKTTRTVRVGTPVLQRRG